MRSIVAAAILACGLAMPSLSLAGIDEGYTKPEERKSWGELLADLFDSDDYGYSKSYALVVGISEFDDFTDLPTAKDPIRIKEFLLNEAEFDYVHVLTEERVTPRRVRELMLDEFRSLVGKNDRFLFYWSGHGHTDLDRFKAPQGYLPTGTSRKDQISGMISMERLAEWDSRLEARQVLYLLDSCFSGHAGAKRQSNIRHVTLEQMAKPSRHIFTAGTSDQVTIATERLQGSIFTHAILEGMRGKADTESVFERDGLVTVNELEDYLKKRVEILRQEALFREPITPQLWDLGQNEGEFFFVSSLRKKQALAELENIKSDQSGHGATTLLSDDRQDNRKHAQEREISEVQEVLAELGYNPGPINGFLGFRTRRAIRKFQSDSKMMATGLIDTPTLDALADEWDKIKRPDQNDRAVSELAISSKGLNNKVPIIVGYLKHLHKHPHVSPKTVLSTKGITEVPNNAESSVYALISSAPNILKKISDNQASYCNFSEISNTYARFLLNSYFSPKIEEINKIGYYDFREAVGNKRENVHHYFSDISQENFTLTSFLEKNDNIIRFNVFNLLNCDVIIISDYVLQKYLNIGSKTTYPYFVPL